MKITRRRFFGIMNQVGQAFLLASGLAACGDFGISDESSGLYPYPYPYYPDLSTVVDLSAAADLSASADLSTNPYDLSTPPDLTTPYDMTYYPYGSLDRPRGFRSRKMMAASPIFERLTDF